MSEIRCFMKLDGIPGTAADSRYPAPWINIESYAVSLGDKEHMRGIGVVFPGNTPGARDIAYKVFGKRSFERAIFVQATETAEIERFTAEGLREEIFLESGSASVMNFSFKSVSLVTPLRLASIPPRLRVALSAVQAMTPATATA